MSIPRLTLALGLAALAPAALAASPVGHWTGKLTFKVPANANPQQKAAMQKAMPQLAQMRFNLDLKSDKTYTVTMTGVPQAKGAPSETGKWSQKGNVVTTTSPKNAGKTQDMTLSPDGKTMTLVLPGGQGKIVFTK